MNNKFDFCTQRTHNNNNNNNNKNKMKLQLIKFTCALIVLKAIVGNAATLLSHIATDAGTAITAPTTTTTTTLLSMDHQMRAKVSKSQKEQAQVQNVAAAVALLTAKSSLQDDNDANDDNDDDDDEIEVDTKLNLNTKVHNTKASQTQLPSITMDSLEQRRPSHQSGVAVQATKSATETGPRAAAAAAAAAEAEAATVAATNIRAKSMTATKRGRSIALEKYKGYSADTSNSKWHSNWNNNNYNNYNNWHNNNNNNDNNYESQPVYELQLVVWPADIEDDFDDAWSRPTQRPTTSSSSSSTTTTTAATTTKRPLIPLCEDQLVIFPQMDFEEENLDYFFDDAIDATPVGATASIPLPIPIPMPTPTPIPKPPSIAALIATTATPPTQSVYVVQDYHIVHPNGTAEYRLELSNGLVNYKKIYNKFVDDYVVPVQEGYDSIPIPGREHDFQTQYYIADEHGYNVYKLEYSHIRPELPAFLSYYGTTM